MGSNVKMMMVVVVVLIMVVLLSDNAAASSASTISTLATGGNCSGSMGECLIIDDEDANYHLFSFTDVKAAPPLKIGGVVKRTGKRDKPVSDCGRGKPYTSSTCLPGKGKPKIPENCIYKDNNRNLNRGCRK